MFGQAGIVNKIKGDIAMPNEEAKKVELVGINLNIFSNWNGPRVTRDVKIGDGLHKFVTGLPVPRSNEEAQDLYKVKLEELIEKGVKQLSYDRDTNLGKEIKKAKDKEDVDFGEMDEDSADGFAEILEDELSTPKVRKVGAATMIQRQLTAAGLSADDLDMNEIAAIIAKKKAEKEEAGE